MRLPRPIAWVGLDESREHDGCELNDGSLGEFSMKTIAIAVYLLVGRNARGRGVL